MKYVRFLLLGVSVLITAGIVSLAVYSFNSSKSIVDHGLDAAKSEAVEWENLDLNDLPNGLLRGAEVANYVRRFKEECIVSVVQDGVSIVYDEYKHFDSSSINATDRFTCTTSRTINDVLSIQFTKVSVSNTAPLSVEQAISELAVATGLNSLNWSELITAVKYAFSGSESAKTILERAVGASNGISWTELTKRVLERMETSEAGSDSEYRFASGDLGARRSFTLTGTPKTIVLYSNEGAQVYENGIWYYEDVVSNEDVSNGVVNGVISNLPWAYVNGDNLVSLVDKSINYKIIY